MPKCKHETVDITVEITEKVIGQAHATFAELTSTKPISIRASVSCPACGYQTVLTTYTNQVTPHPWGRWPKWLTARMILLAIESSELRLALRGLEFPHKIPY